MPALGFRRGRRSRVIDSGPASRKLSPTASILVRVWILNALAWAASPKQRSTSLSGNLLIPPKVPPPCVVAASGPEDTPEAVRSAVRELLAALTRSPPRTSAAPYSGSGVESR
jgi:hypothetical protein